MINYNLIYMMLLTLFQCGCSFNQIENPENWTEDQLSEWFEQKEWMGQTNLQPSSSIDKKKFALLYHENEDRWNIAFNFLKKDLSEIEVGNHLLDGENVYVIVSEYDSKDPEDVQHETHRIYTDIHYVVSGTEYINLTDPSFATEITSYDEDRDIKFHHVDQSQQLLADPETFFIFFPETVHGPGMKVDDSEPMKKVVIKIKSE